MSWYPLAEFELLVMLAVARQGGNAYGASIRREIETRAARPASIGAVYATLGRLTDKGLLRFQVSAPTPVRGGRSRKLYELTSAGRGTLAHSASMLSRMLDGIDISTESA